MKVIKSSGSKSTSPMDLTVQEKKAQDVRNWVSSFGTLTAQLDLMFLVSWDLTQLIDGFKMFQIWVIGYGSKFC